MDWTEFDAHFHELRCLLREIVGDRENINKLGIYGNYLDWGYEIKHIVHRIETEVDEYSTSNRRLFEMMRKNVFDEELSEVRVKYWVLLRLDIKSFFIFTRIFLDTLARIVRLCFGEKGRNLPWSMNKLVKNKVLACLDPEFARELKSRMSRMTILVKHRVEFEHYLGGIPMTTIKDDKFGFIIRGLNIQGDTDGSTVESIADYLRETLFSLSEIILLIYNELHCHIESNGML
jgi:hypothetical protein